MYLPEKYIITRKKFRSDRIATGSECSKIMHSLLFVIKVFNIALAKYPKGVYNAYESYQQEDLYMDEKSCCCHEASEQSESKNCCHEAPEDKSCCHKTKERSEKEYKDLLNRLSRIEGQVRGVKGMVERDAYCVDILTQVSAINAALNSFNKVLLANHIRSCVAENVRNGNDEVIDELVVTMQKLMK